MKDIVSPIFEMPSEKVIKFWINCRKRGQYLFMSHGVDENIKTEQNVTYVRLSKK